MFPAWPPFVTLRDEDTAGVLTRAVWHRCSTEWQAETMTEKFWRDKGWLPHRDEDPVTKQNKARKKSRNTARARQLRKALELDYNPFSTVGKREADVNQPDLVQSIVDMDVDGIASVMPELFRSAGTTPPGSPHPLDMDRMREHLRKDPTLDISDNLLMDVLGSVPGVPSSGLAPEQRRMFNDLEGVVLTTSLEQPSLEIQTGMSMVSSVSSLGSNRAFEDLCSAYEVTAQLVFMEELKLVGYGALHFQNGSIIICARMPRVLFNFLKERRDSTSADSASQDLLLGPLLDLKLQAVMQFGSGSAFLQLDDLLPDQEVGQMQGRMLNAAEKCTPIRSSISGDVDLVYYIHDAREANERLVAVYSAAVIEIVMKAFREAGKRLEDQHDLQRVFNAHEQRQRSVELSQRVLSESVLAQAAARSSQAGSDWSIVMNDSQTPEGNRMRRGEAAPGSATADLSESFEVAGQHSHNGLLPAEVSSRQTTQRTYWTPSNLPSWPGSPALSSVGAPSWICQAQDQLDASAAHQDVASAAEPRAQSAQSPQELLRQWMHTNCPEIADAVVSAYATALFNHGCDRPGDLASMNAEDFPDDVKPLHRTKLSRAARLAFASQPPQPGGDEGVEVRVFGIRPLTPDAAEQAAVTAATEAEVQDFVQLGATATAREDGWTGSLTPPQSAQMCAAPAATVAAEAKAEAEAEAAAGAEVARPEPDNVPRMRVHKHPSSLINAPPLRRMREGSRPAGEPLEELTCPQPPTKQLLAELDGVQPAVQRSRLPARSATAILNEHVACIGAEVDGQLPFEIIDDEGGRANSSLGGGCDDDADSDDGGELILHEDGEEDSKIKERHNSLLQMPPTL